MKYNMLKFIQYLMSITNKEFQGEFNINNNDDMERFIRLVNYYQYINSYDDLKMRTVINKYLEYSEMILEFNDNFELDNIPDDVIIKMFDNFEYRI